MPELYGSPGGEVSFGDIFDASFLFDVFLRADAVQMGSRALPEKYGGGFAYSGGYRDNRAYVLGRGTPHRAILITDNCVIDTALGQRRESGSPKGRLLFAPITVSATDALDTRAFGRFPLPADGGMTPGTAELRKCFMVDARDVANHTANRVASLSHDLADDLEVRWNAFAARRGPLAAGRNAEKMVGVLARQRGLDDADEVEKEVGRAVAGVVGAAWEIEGRYLEAVADAWNDRAEGSDELGLLEGALRELVDRAGHAAELLGRARARG